jgi:molybdate transport system substrate-binding protein
MNQKAANSVRIATTALLLLAGLKFVPTQSRGAEVMVFAASSLTDALKEAGADYEKVRGDKIMFNFGASSMLARQIEEGAPADIFFSADEARMDALEKNGRILKDTRKSRLSNALVIVTTADSRVQIRSAPDLASPDIKRVALADPKSVPSGVYSKQFLESQKLWTAVEPKVVPTQNVRAALAAVESGNVDAGMVFKTDGAISKKVKIACEIAPSSDVKIRYPVAVVKDSKRVEAARQFLHYLNSDAAAKVFQKHGFIVLL